MATSKICIRCNQDKPFKEFPQRNGRRDGRSKGRRNICRGCREYALKPAVVDQRLKDYRKKYRASPKGQYAIVICGIRSRGFKVQITLEEYTELVNKSDGHCHYCGIKFSRNRAEMNTRTMDRKDNQLGYIYSNIVFACRRCNFIKSDLITEPEMIEIAQKYITPKLSRLS